VRTDAPASEVRKAFHASSRAFHPDASRHLDAEHRGDRRSQAHQRAYTVLRDPMRRKAYDESLRGGRRRLQISEADAAAEQQATAELEAPRRTGGASSRWRATTWRGATWWPRCATSRPR
jgi:DnaJ-class molecular chaperone